jgi:hypothetical protein
MATKRQINWALLKQCQELFERKPSKAYMDRFVRVKDRYDGCFDCGDEVPMCKTHLCIGGSALLLSKEYILKQGDYCLGIYKIGEECEVENQWKAAQRVLGISRQQAHRLFSECNWPAQFQSEANNMGSRTLAANMVARIKHFIKTKGRV